MCEHAGVHALNSIKTYEIIIESPTETAQQSTGAGL